MKIVHKRVFGRNHEGRRRTAVTISEMILVAAQAAIFRFEMNGSKGLIYEQAEINNGIRDILNQRGHYNLGVYSEKFADGWEIVVDLSASTMTIIEESINEALDRDRRRP